MRDDRPPQSHITVLLAEAVDAVAPGAPALVDGKFADGTCIDGTFLDGTFGRGGHSRALLARLSPAGRLIGFDKDPEAVAEGLLLAAADPRFSIVHESFVDLR